MYVMLIKVQDELFLPAKVDEATRVVTFSSRRTKEEALEDLALLDNEEALKEMRDQGFLVLNPIITPPSMCELPDDGEEAMRILCGDEEPQIAEVPVEGGVIAALHCTTQEARDLYENGQKIRPSKQPLN